MVIHRIIREIILSQDRIKVRGGTDDVRYEEAGKQFQEIYWPQLTMVFLFIYLA